MVILASLIGVGVAAIFIYKQMGNSVNVTKTAPNKTRGIVPSFAQGARLPATAGQAPDESEHHAAVATLADSSEWHFAEFSDKVRYIDVTYDEGRKTARLKVNTVLSSKPEVAYSAIPDSDVNNEPGNGLTDPGSRFITDPNTGRVIGVDGRVGAAMEVRRAQAVRWEQQNNRINIPAPEVRVASPVMQDGQPVFDSSRPVHAAIPPSTYLPTRKALPVEAGNRPNQIGFDADAAGSDDPAPTRRAVPIRQGANTLPQNQRFPTSDQRSDYGRN